MGNPQCTSGREVATGKEVAISQGLNGKLPKIKGGWLARQPKLMVRSIQPIAAIVS
jgi:hypothetical protein